MSWAIHKYPIALTLEATAEVLMPHNAEILCMQVQRKQPCVWARVDPRERMVTRTFRWFATGQPVDGYPDYVGTLQLREETLVFHLFVDPE